MTPLVQTREARRRLLHRLDRRRTLVAAACVGALSGVVAVVFRWIVERAEAIGHSLALTLLPRGAIGLLLLAILGGALGAFAGWLTDRFATDAGGSAALAAGFSLGREGPTIHLGAAAAEGFARIAHVPARSRRTLIAAGSGAGLAAAFNAPLAGFLFVMEELRREMSPLTYGTSLAASVLAVGVARLLLGQAASFALVAPPAIPLNHLPAVVMVGVACGFVGVLFNRLTMATSGFRIQRKLPRWLCAGLLGIVTGPLLALWPEVTGGGHGVAERILRGEFVHWTLAAAAILLVGKLVMLIVSYATGVPGGIFAPLLVIGSLVGYLVGQLVAPFAPVAVAPTILATVGMASLLASSIRAPLTGVVLIIEMSGQYALLYDLLVAGFAAYAVAELLHDTPIYEALLERDLHGASTAEHDGEVIETFVENGSRLDGARIDGLRLPTNVTVAAIEREGQTIAPRGRTTLRPGDHVTVVVGAGGPAEAALAVVDAARAP